jgi:hypothetical protein
MKSLAAILALCLCSSAFAQSDVDIAIAIAKAKAKLKVETTPVVAEPAKINPATIAAKPKPAPQYRTVTYPAEYRTETYQQKVCMGRQGCHWVTRTRQVQVRPARTVQVPIEPTEAVDSSLSADQQPTPMVGVGTGLNVLNPSPDDVLVDFGCGHDARWLITAVQQHGVKRAIGIEIDPVAAESARRYVAAAGLSKQIEIKTGDAADLFIAADVGVAYLYPETLAKLVPQIQKLDRFVSYGFKVPGLNMLERKLSNGGVIYIWEKPPAMTRVPITQTVNKIVGLPPGSYCTVCGHHCGNPMAHMKQNLIVGYRDVPAS